MRRIIAMLTAIGLLGAAFADVGEQAEEAVMPETAPVILKENIRLRTASSRTFECDGGTRFTRVFIEPQFHDSGDGLEPLTVTTENETNGGFTEKVSTGL